MTTLVINNSLTLAEARDCLFGKSFPAATLEFACVALANTLVSTFDDVEWFAFASPMSGFGSFGEGSDVFGCVLPGGGVRTDGKGRKAPETVIYLQSGQLKKSGPVTYPRPSASLLTAAGGNARRRTK